MSRSLVSWCLAVFVVGLGSSLAAGEPPAKPAMDKAQPFTGKVQPLTKTLEKLGIKTDADSAGITLITGDGTIYGVVKDDASRLLFLDKQLHDRPVQLLARVVPGTQLLKLEKVQTVVNGKPHDIDYWCENCQFPNTQPGPCKCCGGETYFRERLAKQQ